MYPGNCGLDLHFSAGKMHFVYLIDELVLLDHVVKGDMFPQELARRLILAHYAADQSSCGLRLELGL